MTGTTPNETLFEVLREPLAATGLDVEAVELSTAGRRRVVRVLVDKDGGVTLDDLAAATTVVGTSLDNNDVLDDRPYTLEVTSPGTDRPLTAPRHWRRNVSRLVSVTLTDARSIEGRILAAGEGSATVDVHGEPTEVEYADVEAARIQIEFNRPRTEEVG